MTKEPTMSDLSRPVDRKIRNLLEQGMDVYNIAAELDITVTYVQMRLRKLGIDAKAYQKEARAADQRTFIADQYAAGKTVAEIAQALKISIPRAINLLIAGSPQFVADQAAQAQIKQQAQAFERQQILAKYAQRVPVKKIALDLRVTMSHVYQVLKEDRLGKLQHQKDPNQNDPANA